jgi:hypothetical protein
VAAHLVVERLSNMFMQAVRSADVLVDDDTDTDRHLGGTARTRDGGEIPLAGRFRQPNVPLDAARRLLFKPQ